MRKALNSSQPIESISPRAPDLSYLVQSAGWFPNLEKRQMEYRRADGQVLDRRAMTRGELERLSKGADMPRGIAVNLVDFIDQKWNHLTLKAVASPCPKTGAKRGEFECDLCSKRTVKVFSNVRAGLVKSCCGRGQGIATKSVPAETNPFPDVTPPSNYQTKVCPQPRPHSRQSKSAFVHQGFRCSRISSAIFYAPANDFLP